MNIVSWRFLRNRARNCPFLIVYLHSYSNFSVASRVSLTFSNSGQLWQTRRLEGKNSRIRNFRVHQFFRFLCHYILFASEIKNRYIINVSSNITHVLIREKEVRESSQPLFLLQHIRVLEKWRERKVHDSTWKERLGARPTASFYAFARFKQIYPLWIMPRFPVRWRASRVQYLRPLSSFFPAPG